MRAHTHTCARTLLHKHAHSCTSTHTRTHTPALLLWKRVFTVINRKGRVTCLRIPGESWSRTKSLRPLLRPRSERGGCRTALHGSRRCRQQSARKVQGGLSRVKWAAGALQKGGLGRQRGSPGGFPDEIRGAELRKHS